MKVINCFAGSPLGEYNTAARCSMTGIEIVFKNVEKEVLIKLRNCQKADRYFLLTGNRLRIDSIKRTKTWSVESLKRLLC